MANIREMTLRFSGQLGSSMRSSAQAVVKNLDAINGQMRLLERAKLDSAKFTTLRERAEHSKVALSAAEGQLARLSKEMQATNNPSRKLIKDFQLANDEAAKLSTRTQADARQLEHLSRSLKAAGVSTTDMAGDIKKLEAATEGSAARAEEMRRSLAKMQAQEQRTGASAKQMGSEVRYSMLSMAKAAAGAVLAYAGMQKLTEGYKSCMEAANQSIRVNTRLQTLMLNVHGNTLRDVHSVNEYARAQSSATTISENNMVMGVAQLATFKLHAASLKRLVPAFSDLAVGIHGVNVQQQDAYQVGNLIGKMLSGNAGAAGRFGIIMSKQQKLLMKNGNEIQRVSTLLTVIHENYGNVATALAKTPEGRVVLLQNAFEAVRKTIGDKLLPVQQKVLVYLTTHLPQIKEAVRNIIDTAERWIAVGKRIFGFYEKHSAVLKPLLIAVGGAFLFGELHAKGMAIWTKISSRSVVDWVTSTKLVTAAQWLWNASLYGCPLVWIIAGVAALAAGIYLLVRNWDKVTRAMRLAWDWFLQFATKGAGRFIPFIAVIGQIATHWKEVKAVLLEVWDALKQVWEIAAKFTSGMWNKIASVGSAIGGGVSRAYGAASRAIAPHSVNAYNWFAGNATGAIVNRRQLSWLAEKGPEAVIPLRNDRSRARSLWATAGAQLGMAGGGGITVHFSPTINMSGSGSKLDISAALGRSADDLEARLSRLMDDRRRRSMD